MIIKGSKLKQQINSNHKFMKWFFFKLDDKDGERSSRGLRSLSLKVKEIVVNKA